MTEICDWRAFPTARTAKHFSFPLKYIKILIPTPPSFSARAHFWCFNLQQHSLNLQQLVLKICSKYFKFATTLFYLQQLHFICSNVFLNMQQLYFIRRNVLICSMSLVGHRIHFIKVDWKCIFILYKIKFARGADVWNSLSSFIYVKSEKTSIQSSND